MQPGVRSTPFGRLPDGRRATLYTLINRHGLVARISDFGGIVSSLLVPDRKGALGDIVLGYDSAEPYWNDGTYFGALIGRYANRLRDGRFG